MRLLLKTKVKGNYKSVMDHFDRDLFEALKPKGAKMEIVQFTGSEKGDTVHIRFVSPIKAEWISKITEHGADENKAYFVDEGETLPFPLKKWKHIHGVEKVDESSSIIVDDINFSSGYKIIDILLYPLMFVGFYPRKNIYKIFFSKKFVEIYRLK